MIKLMGLLAVMVVLATGSASAQSDLPTKNVIPLQKPAPTVTAPAAPGEMEQRKALLERYLTPARYDSLYQSVIDQYAVMAPNNGNALSLKEDPNFRDQIFTVVQKRASTTFTLPELQAMQRFIDSPEGSSISNKVNALGLQFRQKELDEGERTALRNFSQSPEGKSIAGKSVSFASSSLGEVLRAVLVRQAMSSGIQ